MKVKELIKILSELPEDNDVIIQQEQCMSEYAYIQGASEQIYFEDNFGKEDEIMEIEDDAEDGDLEEEEWIEAKQKLRVVMIF